MQTLLSLSHYLFFIYFPINASILHNSQMQCISARLHCNALCAFQAFIGKHFNNHTDNFNRVTFVTRELMSHEGLILTKCFEIRKYQTSYWNINMKAHWRGFMSILNPKAVFTLYQMPPTFPTCLPIKLSCDCRNLAVNSLKFLVS